MPAFCRTAKAWSALPTKSGRVAGWGVHSHRPSATTLELAHDRQHRAAAAARRADRRDSHPARPAPPQLYRLLNYIVAIYLIIIGLAGLLPHILRSQPARWALSSAKPFTTSPSAFL